jgi:N-acetylmuramoyl-L-alanine amidase
MPLRLLHDPGHGGDSHGIVYADVVEKDLVLEIARDVAAGIGSVFGAAVEQRFTRESDIDVGLKERGEIADEWGAGLVLSHHTNGIFDEKGNPLEEIDGLYCGHLPGNWRARETGAAIMRAAPAELLRRKFKPYPAQPGNWTSRMYNVLRWHASRPAVLIEWGYVTSPRDRSVLTLPASRPAMVASAIAGVARLIELRHS